VTSTGSGAKGEGSGKDPYLDAKVLVMSATTKRKQGRRSTSAAPGLGDGCAACERGGAEKRCGVLWELGLLLL
jgi:hypothetical protein